MSEKLSLGQRGEDFAAAFLEEKGYKIRHRNWRSGKKELDIIAENSEYVVFVEVKTRTEGFIEPPTKVFNGKRKLMIYAAEAYIQKYEINKNGRFDVIIVIAKGNKLEIGEHIEGAFYPTLR